MCAQEALGGATILSNGSAADAVANYKEAFYRYQQVGSILDGGLMRVGGWVGTIHIGNRCVACVQGLSRV
jgi:hypothetical protein